jgi:Ni,Fe-hydrogenase I cytochrome b subunit
MQPAASLSGRRVYDPVLRLLHWYNAVLIVSLLLSGMIAQRVEPGALSGWLHQQHGWLGAGLVLGLIGRLVWGLVGTHHARLSDLWHPAVWLEIWRTRLLFSAPQRMACCWCWRSAVCCCWRSNRETDLSSPGSVGTPRTPPP